MKSQIREFVSTEITLTVGYRAVRVKLLFLLPRRIRHMYGGILVFAELFTRFGVNLPRNPMKFLQISHSMSSQNRQTLVFPVEKLRMSCHLSPKFPNSERSNTWLKAISNDTDLLETCKTFYLNPFSSHFTYNYFEHWHPNPDWNV